MRRSSHCSIGGDHAIQHLPKGQCLVHGVASLFLAQGKMLYFDHEYIKKARLEHYLDHKYILCKSKKLEKSSFLTMNIFYVEVKSQFNPTLMLLVANLANTK